MFYENDVHIRNMNASDYDNYFILQEEVSITSKLLDYPGMKEYSWNDLMQENRMNFVIETNQNEFCGYCAIKDIREDKPEIEMELLKRYQGRGIGYQALKMMIKIGIDENKSGFVSVVATDNEASHKLMKKLNGVEVGTREGSFASFMEKIREDDDIKEIFFKVASKYDVDIDGFNKNYIVYEFEFEKLIGLL